MTELNKQCTCFRVADEHIVCPVCVAQLRREQPLPDWVAAIAEVDGIETVYKGDGEFHSERYRK